MSALERLVTPGSRVLDVGVRDWGLADALDSIGVHRYLGLVLPEDRGVVDTSPDRLARRFHVLRTPAQIQHNDTDLLVLRAPVSRATWAVRDLGHVSHLAVERTSVPSWLDTHSSLAISRLLGRAEHLGTAELAGSHFEVFGLRPKRWARPRHYLSEAVGVPGLIERLESERLDYVVLRWFEQLPHLDPGEDLDILVGDHHLDRLHEILAEEPGTIPVDIYSETGLSGADFLDMAYYPPRLAARILARAHTHASGARVPSPEDHLHSLAYHAVYHKGAASGLPSSLVEAQTRPDHDYAAAMTTVATSLGRDWPTSLEDVDDELAAQGWRPPPDTLRRLAGGNAWIQRRFFTAAHEQTAELPEPTIFFIRERTLTAVDRRRAIGVIESFEFEILTVRELSGTDRARSSELVRGGNWGRGPFPVSGGQPALVVVAVHYGPRPPNETLRHRYPRLTNGDVLHAKVAMRELVEATVGPDGAFNPVHSADDEAETWEYIDIALPAQADELRTRVRQRRDLYRTTAPVLNVLSHGRRAKVEVVAGAEGGPVVRKTFAPTGMRHMKREITTMEHLAPRIDAIPRLLRTGPNWFETPLYDNQLADLPDRPTGRLVPLRIARDMVRTLQDVHSHGFDLIDVKPQNFLLEPNGRLRIVDFEFSHRYPGPAPQFGEIYGFAGAPDDFDDDLPFGELSYESRWYPFVGLPLDSLLHDPVWRQHVRRSLVRAAHLGRAPARLTRAGLRRGRSGVRAARTHVGASYRQWARQRARVLS